jgi:lipid II:glycine glycyltransferase (peptidoglycan interpeptide bridge formation enzyme)
VKTEGRFLMEVSVTKEGLDPEWDRFLETLPDGCYQQSSLWAKVKAGQGWRHLRLVVREQGGIVGGAQMLLRPLPLFGSVGYIPKGPVFASDNPAVQEFILDQLDRVARAERIPFLKVQPAYGAEDLVRRLTKRGAQPSEVPVTAQATVRVDLRPTTEEILTQMKRGARWSIRRAEREGVTVRVGAEADLPTLYHLKKTHAEQRGYSYSSEHYDQSLFSILADHFCFFLAEYEGQVVASISHIVFGDTMFGYHVGASGPYRAVQAPSLTVWKAMLWAKERGFAWYDFGGIAEPIARAMQRNESLPDHPASGRARWKKSFGGELVFRPDAYDVSFVWPKRLTVRLVPALMKVRPLFSLLIGGSLARYVQRMDQDLTYLEEAG